MLKRWNFLKTGFYERINLAVTKVPDATPGIIAKYALNDEQAVLARVRAFWFGWSDFFPNTELYDPLLTRTVAALTHAAHSSVSCCILGSVDISS